MPDRNPTTLYYKTDICITLYSVSRILSGRGTPFQQRQNFFQKFFSENIYSFSAALELCSRDSERGRRMQLVWLVGVLVGGLVGQAAAQCSPSPCGVNTQCDVNPAGAAVCRSEFHIPGGRKEMSSILADPIAPSYMSPNEGGGKSCEVSANKYSCAVVEPK
jgi:hypothetical protein